MQNLNKKIEEFIKEVDKLYFNGSSLKESILKANKVLPLSLKTRVLEWLRRNFKQGENYKMEDLREILHNAIDENGLDYEKIIVNDTNLCHNQCVRWIYT